MRTIVNSLSLKCVFCTPAQWKTPSCIGSLQLAGVRQGLRRNEAEGESGGRIGMMADGVGVITMALTSIEKAP